MILLDTNVLSALMRSSPEPSVVAWLDRQPRPSVWITSVTTLEIQFGLATMPDGRRAAALRDSFEQLVAILLEGRVASFDPPAAAETATLMADRQRRGQPQELRDSMIAGIAKARRATLATRNVRHFGDAGLDIVNPWTG